MIIIIENGNDDQSSNLDEAIFNLFSANNLGKSINPTILPPAIGK